MTGQLSDRAVMLIDSMLGHMAAAASTDVRVRRIFDCAIPRDEDLSPFDADTLCRLYGARDDIVGKTRDEAIASGRIIWGPDGELDININHPDMVLVPARGMRLATIQRIDMGHLGLTRVWDVPNTYRPRWLKSAFRVVASTRVQLDGHVVDDGTVYWELLGGRWQARPPPGCAVFADQANYVAGEVVVRATWNARALESAWTVDIAPPGAPRIRLPTDAHGVLASFKDRDKPEGSRRSALLHWVKEHVRWVPRPGASLAAVDVRKHLRGATKFRWRDLEADITPSKADRVAAGRKTA